MTDEKKRKNLRERFNRVRTCCNNSAYTRPHDYYTPLKRSFWQRVKDLCFPAVIKRSTTPTPERDKLIHGDIGIPEVNLELKSPPITGPMRRLKDK